MNINKDILLYLLIALVGVLVYLNFNTNSNIKAYKKVIDEINVSIEEEKKFREEYKTLIEALNDSLEANNVLIRENNQKIENIDIETNEKIANIGNYTIDSLYQYFARRYGIRPIR